MVAGVEPEGVGVIIGKDVLGSLYGHGAADVFAVDLDVELSAGPDVTDVGAHPVDGGLGRVDVVVDPIAGLRVHDAEIVRGITAWTGNNFGKAEIWRLSAREVFSFDARWNWDEGRLGELGLDAAEEDAVFKQFSNESRCRRHG